MTICRKINISVGAKGRNRINIGDAPILPEFKAKPSRAAETLSFAILFESWIESGTVSDYSDIARITGLSRFMVTKIMSQLLLPAREQVEILRNGYNM